MRTDIVEQSAEILLACSDIDLAADRITEEGRQRDVSLVGLQVDETEDGSGFVILAEIARRSRVAFGA